MDTDPLLDRIRNLLAKAESTPFEAEAEAFTAKAQELMTRHAIDQAMLVGDDRRDGEVPTVIRLPLQAPYVNAKSLLLQVVADAGRCRAVFETGRSVSSVVGFPDDLAAVQLLFTSLLVQAQTALSESARHAPPGTQVRSRGYRSSFLVAFAVRIGERLRAVNEAVTAQAEAEIGSAFLPVLRARSDEVDEAFAAMGPIRQSRVSSRDAAGWAGGTAAADRARLSSALQRGA